MTEACLNFCDLAPGCARHTAVHDLTGDVGKGSLIAVIGGRERKSGTLYSEALSSADGPAPSYLDMLQHKDETLAAAINKG